MYYELHLPFPPTVNNYYVKTKRGVYISMKGRKFRSLTSAEVIKQLPEVHFPATERLLVEVVLYPPDKRKRDLGNYDKALMDAITHSGLWEDDSQIDQQFFYRGVVHSPSGKTLVRILDAGPVLALDYSLPTR